MNQADVSKLISQLRISIAPRHRKLKNVDGPEGRLLKLRKTVTGLVKHERIELNYARADEARGYVERLISEAIRYGDCHRTTMELADYWLLEKQFVHKLFKVLVPRFRDSTASYTRLLRAPLLNGEYRPRAVLELRGHPYPPLVVETGNNRALLHNVLLDEAAKAYRAQKVSGAASALLDKIESQQLGSLSHFQESQEESGAEVMQSKLDSNDVQSKESDGESNLQSKESDGESTPKIEKT